MRPTFTSALTLAASLIINVAALAAWEWNTQAQLAPPGEVTVTQVVESAEQGG